jgi:quinol monooxygenase YgiN
MIIVAGTVRVAPQRIEELRPAAEAIIKATRAEAGCRVYSFAEDIVDPGLVRIFEIWESRAHLDAHVKQPHMQPWRDALKRLDAKDRDVRIYEASGGEPL